MIIDWFLAKPTELATCSVVWAACVAEVRIVAICALEHVLNQPEPEFTEPSDAEDPPEDPNDPADEDPADVEVGKVVELTCLALALGLVVVFCQGGQAQLTLVDSIARTRAMTRALILVGRRRGHRKWKERTP